MRWVCKIMDASIVMRLKHGYLTNIWTIYMHSEKLHLLKPHCSITIYKKKLIYNYHLGITTTMQLSPWKYGELINNFSC